MDRIHAVIGPLATNVYVLADSSTREAIAIDTAIPCLEWISGALAERDWTLRLVISTHGHWDHTGDNAAVAEHTGARIAVHPLDAHRLMNPQPLYAPFPIPPCVPAVELAEGGEVRFGEIRLLVLHTPGHTEGSVACTTRTEATSTAVTRCSRAAGVASTSPVGAPRQWRIRSRGWPGWTIRCASCRGMARPRRFAANVRGWISFDSRDAWPDRLSQP